MKIRHCFNLFPGHAEEHMPSLTYTLKDNTTISNSPKPQVQKDGSDVNKAEGGSAAEKNSFFATLNWNESNESEPVKEATKTSQKASKCYSYYTIEVGLFVAMRLLYCVRGNIF